MILHRAWRDTSRCAKKYGDDWLEYKRRVPYLFVPVSLFPFFLLIGDDGKVNRDGRDSISFRTANTWERKEELEGKKKKKELGGERECYNTMQGSCIRLEMRKGEGVIDCVFFTKSKHEKKKNSPHPPFLFPFSLFFLLYLLSYHSFTQNKPPSPRKERKERVGIVGRTKFGFFSLFVNSELLVKIFFFFFFYQGNYRKRKVC